MKAFTRQYATRMAEFVIHPPKTKEERFRMRLNQLCLRDEVVLRDLCAKVGIAPATMSRYINGHENGHANDGYNKKRQYGLFPSMRTAIKMAKYFNVTPDYLLGETDDDVSISESLRQYSSDLATKCDELQKTLSDFSRKIVGLSAQQVDEFPLRQFVILHILEMNKMEKELLTQLVRNDDEIERVEFDMFRLDAVDKERGKTK